MYKVLIVEDDPMVAMINEQYIARNPNFHVLGTCGDGQKALELLEHTSVDLVVMDVYMPVVNGLEAMRALRNKQIDSDFIMVTAANDRETLEEALRLGVIDYLVKPFTFDRFQQALDKFLLQRQALYEVDSLNQKTIDSIITTQRHTEPPPKGVQIKTMNLLYETLKNQKGVWLTGEEIAQISALTSVTVRRYMNYLAETGKIDCEINYETGGRPCMKYKSKE